MIKIYTDAAVRPIDQQASAGCVIVTDQQQYQLKTALGPMDNHQAEFAAAIWGFEQLQTLQLPPQIVMFYTDSRLVSDAITKNYSHHYAQQLALLNDQLDRFDPVVVQWIPDRDNQGAHHLALQALS